MTTPFQEKVYAATRQIPKGCTASYGQVAAMIGCGSPRAVGQALKRNPYAPGVPCHRVVAADGSLGGYFGASRGQESKRKKQLLLGEGVSFRADGLIISRPGAEQNFLFAGQ